MNIGALKLDDLKKEYLEQNLFNECIEGELAKR